MCLDKKDAPHLNIRCTVKWRQIDGGGYPSSPRCTVEDSESREVCIPLFKWMSSDTMTNDVNKVVDDTAKDFIIRYITNVMKEGEELPSIPLGMDEYGFRAKLVLVSATVVQKLQF